MFEHWIESGALERLLYAICAGLILGFPYRRHPGGIRTHVLVTLGAAYFCITAIQLLGKEGKEVIRVIQGVTSGIGFVGAASVLKQDGAVHGIANAASIWIAAAVGCDAAFGTGRSVLIMASVITLLTVLIGWCELYFRKREPLFARRGPPRFGIGCSVKARFSLARPSRASFISGRGARASSGDRVTPISGGIGLLGDGLGLGCG